MHDISVAEYSQQIVVHFVLRLRPSHVHHEDPCLWAERERGGGGGGGEGGGEGMEGRWEGEREGERESREGERVGRERRDGEGREVKRNSAKVGEC